MMTVQDFSALVYDSRLVYFVKTDGSDNQLFHTFDQGTAELMSWVLAVRAYNHVCGYMHSVESHCTKGNTYDTVPVLK